MTLHTDTPDRIPYALQALGGAYDIAAPGTPFTATPIVLERIA
jgi:thymidine phosphorylase